MAKKRVPKSAVSKKEAPKVSKWEQFVKELKFESYFSMVLGLLVVVGLGFLIFNSFLKRAKKTEFPTEPETKVEEKVSPTPEIAGETYTVILGDSLSKIAERAYGDKDAWVKIAEANNVWNPKHIEPGTVLQIPR